MVLEAGEIDGRGELEADVCIVGGGAAGISLALELRGSGLKVLLVEGGGRELEAANQQLYEASQVGIQTDPLHVNRLRVFGGTTGHWGAWRS
jgi:2-polyprenyl-6-methoxyphenol hydroxylase-like FAD-dependent oxidoreductase